MIEGGKYFFYSMFSHYFFSTATLTLLVVGCNIIAVNAFAEEVVLISTGEYAPWTGKALRHNGFVNHVITEAFKRGGYSAQYTYYPWKRNYQQAKLEKFHATSYWYKSKDRENDFYYSDPISTEKLVFFHLKSNPMIDWDTLNDLRKYRIGATNGYTYTKEFWDAEKSKKLEIQTTNSDAQNFLKLLKGRIDIFPATLLTGKSILQKEFDIAKSTLITFHPKPLSETTGHLLFPKSREDSEKLIQLFNKGLAMLKKEGLYDKFMDDLLAGKYSK